MKYDQFYYEYEVDRGDERDDDYPPPARGMASSWSDILGSVVSGMLMAFVTIFAFEWLFGDSDA